MYVQRVHLGINHYTWMVIDVDHLPVKPIANYLSYLSNTEKSPNTIQAYAKRQASSVNAVLAAVSSFYRYFKLLHATTNRRDYFLVHLLFETGLRIGQALRLRHEDIKSWDNEILIQSGDPTLHSSQNKSDYVNLIHVSLELMQSYSNYLAELENDVSHEFVFINLIDFVPLSYNAIRKLFIRLTKATGIKVKPHMLRHTHATELLRAGWDPAFVQKRLGHRHVCVN